MTKLPQPRTSDELAHDAAISASAFRSERLGNSDAWATQYKAAREKFESLFEKLGDFSARTITDKQIANVQASKLGETLRYLAGPPISDDDLKVIANVETLAPGILRKRPEELRRVYEVVERLIDQFRFPWIRTGLAPSAQQREAALMASAVLLATQRLATERRHDGKDIQETKVKNYLLEIGFTQTTAVAIGTIVKGPQTMQFCAECQLGERKADVVVRLHDTRLMAIECKVSNSATNSVKRLNNDAAVKGDYWLKQFGTAQVVPAAMLSGVFKVLNLE